MTTAGVEWRCFHRDEVFTTEESARDHFGYTQFADPGCIIDKVAVEEGGKPERGRGLLMALRKAEAELARYREEDTDLHRAIHRLQGEHATALRREEERGYDRGLRDARHVEPLTPQDCADLQRAARYLASNNDADGEMSGAEANRIATVLRGIAGLSEAPALDYVEWKRRYAARLMHHGWNERAAIKEAEYVWQGMEGVEKVSAPEDAADQATADARNEDATPGVCPAADQTFPQQPCRPCQQVTETVGWRCSGQCGSPRGGTA